MFPSSVGHLDGWRDGGMLAWPKGWLLSPCSPEPALRHFMSTAGPTGPVKVPHVCPCPNRSNLETGGIDRMECVAPQLFRNRQTRQYLLAPCGRWSCPACGRMLAARWRAILQWVTDRGQPPQYLLTLTLRNVLPLWREAPPVLQAQQKEAATALTRFLTRALTRLVAEIRQRFGPFEYVAFVELTTGRRTPGHRPHLHLLVRGPAISPAWLSKRWCFHTHGSFRVDFQPVRSAMHAAGYLVGYTVGQRKKEQQMHLTSWPGPRVRYSRGYFPARVAAIREQLLSAWREDSGQEPPEGSWEWLGPAKQHAWWRWQMALRLAAAPNELPAGEWSPEVRAPTGCEAAPGLALTGQLPSNLRKEAASRTANPSDRDRPARPARTAPNLPKDGRYVLQQAGVFRRARNLP